VPKYCAMKPYKRHGDKVPAFSLLMIDGGENSLLTFGRVPCVCYAGGVVGL
jgi:hypothetical protein